jgi:coatomer protein complex subunit alpha (xenin)
MRVELERKKLVAAGSQDPARVTELSCYRTLCGMDNAHRFLAFKNAMTSNYKLQNFITASHFARQVLDLEPTGIFASQPDVIAQHKKYFQAFQAKGTNALKLDFNQNLNVEITEIQSYLCLGSLRPLADNRAQATLKCPLCASVATKEYAGQKCGTCELAILGEDVMGLNIEIESPK